MLEVVEDWKNLKIAQIVVAQNKIVEEREPS